MTSVSFEDAIPIVNERAENLRKSIYSAADVNLELTNDYLIKNWLDKNAISVVFGDSNSGKSFFAVDLAYHVASGKNWFGNRVKTGQVLYIAAEGGRGFNKRIAAVKNSKPDLREAGCKTLLYFQCRLICMVQKMQRQSKIKPIIKITIYWSLIP